MFKLLKSKKGFTLLELVVVVSIIAILALIAVPVAIPQIERSRFSRTQADLDSFIKGVEIFYIENNQFPEDFHDLKGYVNKLKTENPYGGRYGYTNNHTGVYLSITDMPENRKEQLYNKLISNSVLAGNEYRYCFRDCVPNMTTEELIEQGFIPISNVEDFFAIDGSNSHTFARDTDYETPKEAGEFGLDSDYILVADIDLGELCPYKERFGGRLIGNGHKITGNGCTIFVILDGIISNVVLDGVHIGESNNKEDEIGVGDFVFNPIQAGNRHSFSIIDGEVYSWGDNSSGQLGLGDTTSRTTPQAVTELQGEQIKQIIGGESNSVALTRSGKVYVWGNNITTPQLLNEFGGRKITQISTKGNHTTALTECGIVYIWGNSGSSPLAVNGFNGERVIQVTAGNGYYLALTESGDVYSWGSNNLGQLGLGNTTNYSSPQLISGLEGKTISQIVSSGNSSFLLTQDGKLYSWGANNLGQLGLSDNNNRHSPQFVSYFTDIKIVRIITGYDFVYAVTNDGRVFAWGDNTYGQLGLGSSGGSRNTPQLVNWFSGKNTVHIILGWHHIIVTTSDGRTYSWGRNNNGQLGTGDTEDKDTPIEVPIETPTDDDPTTPTEPIESNPWLSDGYIVQVSAGNNHSLVLTEDGNVYSWGAGFYGQLGTGISGNGSSRPTPQHVTALSGKNIVQVSAGVQFSLALTEDGNVYSWGDGRSGQLGLGNTSQQNTPREVTTLSGKNIVQIVAGSLHALALTADGEVYSWGRGSNGRLGLGDTINQDTPRLIEALENREIIQIQAGSSHSLALTKSGDIYGWGRNLIGTTLGIITENENQTTPILINRQSLVDNKIVQISASHSHNLALTEDGDVYAWGSNNSGALGLDSGNGVIGIPTRVQGLISDKKIIGVETGGTGRSVSSGHSFVITETGDVYSWGDNSAGQAGHRSSGITCHFKAPMHLESLSDKGIIQINLGGEHSLALTKDGNVYSWGGNWYGQLGLGNSGSGTNRDAPTIIPYFQAKNAE